jgi:deazaflavin-dependent oxidoreductase (nitroreductase family)
MSQAPSIVRKSNSFASRLLRAGMPMGPNLLLTVRGRSSGQPRTFPVAVVEVGGRRWVAGAYGDVQWTRNLRAAGEADLEAHGRVQHVRARELSREEATTWFRDVFQPYVGRLPFVGRMFGRVFFGLVSPEFMTDPERAAATRPVFELTLAGAAGSE